jgi:cytoskeleton protein RodZ
MTDNTTLEAASPITTTYSPLGEVLSATRTTKKLTQQDVSNHLRFSIKQVDALENDQFDALPDAMITRGFIRNYARYLGLDAEPLLESYKARVPTKSPSAMSVQSSMYQVMSGKDSQPWLKYILGSILVLLFLLAWIFYIDYMPKNSKPSSNKAPETVMPNAPTEVPLPEIALPAAEREAAIETLPGADPAASPESMLPSEVSPDPVAPEASGAVVPNAPTSSPTASNTLTNPALPETAQKPVAKAPVPASSTSASALPVAPVSMPTVTSTTAVSSTALSPAKAITLSVTEKTWINVTDKAGKVVYEKTLPAGSADAIDGEPPLNVTVGNAKATTLSYKGQPVNLASSMTENNVARIKLE